MKQKTKSTRLTQIRCLKCRDLFEPARGTALHRAACPYCQEPVGARRALELVSAGFRSSATLACILAVAGIVFAIAMLIKGGKATIDQVYLPPRSWMHTELWAGNITATITLVLSLLMLGCGVSALCRPHRRLLLPIAILQALQGLRGAIPCVLGVFLASQLLLQFHRRTDDVSQTVATVLVLVLYTMALWLGALLGFMAWHRLRMLLRDEQVPDEEKPVLLDFRPGGGSGMPETEPEADDVPFGAWYGRRLGKLHVAAQVLAWLLYGFFWIPAWYCCKHGQFGKWYQAKFGRLPTAIQVVIWIAYGFVWIPSWYTIGKRLDRRPT